MINFLKRHKFYFTIIVISFLCWGRLLTLRGIWWDDWLWIWHYFSSKDFSVYLSPWIDLGRILDAYQFFLSFRLLDIIPQFALNVWNIWKFIMFTINAILLYHILKSVLRNKSILPETIAIVYLVSPLVNNISLVETGRRLYLMSFFLSILFSIKSINKGRIIRSSYLLAILFSLFSMFSLESFIPFDLARAIIIFYIFSNKLNEKFSVAMRKTLLYWIPFLIMGIIIALYKTGLLIPRPRFGPFEGHFVFYNLPIHRYIGIMIYQYVRSFYYLFLFHLFYFINRFPLAGEHFLAMLLSFIATLVAVIFIFKNDKFTKKEDVVLRKSKLNEIRLVAIFGIFLIVIGLFLYLLYTRSIEFGDNSRHALLASIGASIFIPAILLWLYTKGLIKKLYYYLLLTGVIFLGVFECNAMVTAHHNDWQQQRSFWWQFIWRVPAIKDKTFLIVDMPREEEDYFGIGWNGSFQFGCPLNLLYIKSKEKSEMYNHFAEWLGRAILEDEGHYLKNWNKDEASFPFLFPFKYYPPNLLLASYHNGYLYLNKDISKENSSQGLVNIEPLVANSSERQIIYKDSEINYPFRWIIGPEPRKIKKSLRYEIRDKIFGKNVYKDWRYYFQRIKALEYIQDYKGTVDLYNEAESLGWNPHLPQSAPLCVVKAFYLTGNIQKANLLLWKWALSSEGDYKKALDMLTSIESINNDSNLHAVINKEINNIWKGIKAKNG